MQRPATETAGLGSALESRERHALDQLLLTDQEDDDGRDNRDGRGRHQQRPLRGILTVSGGDKMIKNGAEKMS